MSATDPPSPTSSSALSTWVVGLASFVLGVGLLVNLALPRLPWQPQRITTLDYTQAFFAHGAHSDSWKPMRTALFYLDEPRRKPLYEAVYFDNNVRFQYPPSSLLVLEALRLLPVSNPIGDETLNGISWISVWGIAIVVARILIVTRRRVAPTLSCSRGDEAILVALALFTTLTFYPVVRGYYLGQIQVWLDLLIAGVVLAWIEGRRGLSGVLLSLICVIKPTLALLIVWGVLRRHWDFVRGFAIPMTGFAVISLAAYGWDNHVDYLKVLSYISRQGEVFHPNQSMNGLLHRWLGNGDSIEWDRNLLVAYDPRVHAGTVLSSLALVAIALLPRGVRAGGAPRSETGVLLDLSIAIVCSTLASPTVWTHHYGVTLPIFALLLPLVLTAAPERRTRWLGALAIAFVLIGTNFRALNRLAETPLDFLQSYVYFGGLLLLGLICVLERARRRSRSPSDFSPRLSSLASEA